jgi:hypothetical protein
LLTLYYDTGLASSDEVAVLQQITNNQLKAITFYRQECLTLRLDPQPPVLLLRKVLRKHVKATFIRTLQTI